ncbi:hypothetical protein ACX93W_00305 [Paenibacillus sp. CAU 1782]
MKKAASVFIVLIISTGCGTIVSDQGLSQLPNNNDSQAEQSAVSTTMPDLNPIQLAYDESLIFSPATPITPVEPSMQLENQSADGAEIIVFGKHEETIYAALQTKEATYEIGQMGYGEASGYSVSTVDALGETFIKVAGAVGANAPISYYVSHVSNPPTLLHIEANTVEADVDQDGIKEIVATVGSAAETTIYKMENHILVSVNLNEIMDASVVVYDANANAFQADVVKGRLSDWAIKDNQLKFQP